MHHEIVIHSLDQAMAALAAAETLNVPVTLASAPDAALQTGPFWFRSVLDAAVEAHPKVVFTAILDCGDEAGAVLAALRMGFRHLRFSGPDKVRTKLAAMGVDFVGAPTAVLDLLNARDPGAACRAFLTRLSA